MYSWLEKTDSYPNQKLVPLAEKYIFSQITNKTENENHQVLTSASKDPPSFPKKIFSPQVNLIDQKKPKSEKN